jgi:hypothetical protein
MRGMMPGISLDRTRTMDDMSNLIARPGMSLGLSNSFSGGIGPHGAFGNPFLHQMPKT